MPPNRVEYLDKRTMCTYYVNTLTGATSWTRPVHDTEQEMEEDQAAAAAAAVAVGAQRTHVSESDVKQPAAVQPPTN